MPGRGRGQGDLLVQVVRHADVDRIDVGPLDQPAPVGLDRPDSPRLSAKACALAASRAQTACSTGRCCEFGEEVLDLPIGIGMGPAHEAVADHADPTAAWSRAVISLDWLYCGTGPEPSVAPRERNQETCDGQIRTCWPAAPTVAGPGLGRLCGGENLPEAQLAAGSILRSTARSQRRPARTRRPSSRARRASCAKPAQAIDDEDYTRHAASPTRPRADATLAETRAQAAIETENVEQMQDTVGDLRETALPPPTTLTPLDGGADDHAQDEMAGHSWRSWRS